MARLKEIYWKEIAPKLKEELKLSNVMEVPRVTKITQGEQVDPRNPQSALTGCNSDRDVGLLGRPTPQIDEGPEVTCKRPGRRFRKEAPAASPGTERTPGWRRAESLLPCGCPQGKRQGAILPRGRALPFRRGGAIRSEWRRKPSGRRDRRYGRSARTGGRSALATGSESNPWWSVRGRRAAMRTDRWEVRPFVPGQTGAGGETDLPRGESQP
jgi:hypothetical protein